MMHLRTNITLFSLVAFIFFAVSLGMFKGLVLCYGADGHIHTEITFNGVDCGHFPTIPSDAASRDYLTKFNPASHPPHCISCIDIPLSLHYSLKKFNNTSTQRPVSKIRNISSLFLPVPINQLIASSAALSRNYPEQLSPPLHLLHNTILLL